MTGFVSAPPPRSASFTKEDNLGRLLLIQVLAINKENGDYGEQDVLVADVWVLDGPHAGEHYQAATIYGRRLVGQARATLDAGVDRMLGRLARGQARKGQPPWILDAPSAEDVETANRWAAAELAQQPPAAQPPTAQAAPAGYVQQPSAAQPGQAAPAAQGPAQGQGQATFVNPTPVHQPSGPAPF